MRIRDRDENIYGALVNSAFLGWGSLNTAVYSYVAQFISNRKHNRASDTDVGTQEGGIPAVRTVDAR